MRGIWAVLLALTALMTPAAAVECWSPDRYFGCLVAEGVVSVWHGTGKLDALLAADESCKATDPGPPPDDYSEACGEYADTRQYVRQKAADIIDYAAERQAF